jgi:hypothetical protein
MDRAEQIRVGRNSLEHDRTLFFLAVRQNHIHGIDPERIAFHAFHSRAAATFRGRLVFFALAFLERLQIVQDVVPHFFQIFRNRGARIFFLQLFNHAVHQHRSRFLLQVTHFAGQFARE